MNDYVSASPAGLFVIMISMAISPNKPNYEPFQKFLSTFFNYDWDDS